MDFNWFSKEVNNELTKASIKVVDILLESWLNYVNENSPVDTWNYKDNNKVIPAIVSWTAVKWIIYNDTSYADKVETWFKKGAVNWHINDRNKIFNSIWANVFEKMVTRVTREINEDITMIFNNITIK